MPLFFVPAITVIKCRNSRNKQGGSVFFPIGMVEKVFIER